MEDLKSSLRYVSFGFELVGMLLIPTALAYYIDISYGNPSISWIFGVGLFFGLVGTYLRLKSVITAINVETESKTQGKTPKNES